MLRFVNICKNFGSQTAVQNVHLEVKQGEFFSLLGPSGCGKTTLLRMLAGFETPTSGEILLNDVRIDVLPPQKRPLNMVFQRYALFPHLTVFENVAFGPKLHGIRDIKAKVENALTLVGLKDFASRLPETLSGGQAQRVALARAIVNEPKVLLLDEPLSALDQKMREHMQTELRQLQKKIGITFIFVTHDQAEAMILSDCIGVMNGGRLEQVSTPKDLYENPATAFCAQFIGNNNELTGKVASASAGYIEASMRGGFSLKGRTLKPIGTGTTIKAYVRPEQVELLTTQSSSTLSSPAGNMIPGRVAFQAYHGSFYEIHVEVTPETHLRVLRRPDQMKSEMAKDTPVWLSFSPQETFIFEH